MHGGGETARTGSVLFLRLSGDQLPTLSSDAIPNVDPATVFRLPRAGNMTPDIKAAPAASQPDANIVPKSHPRVKLRQLTPLSRIFRDKLSRKSF